MVSTPVPDSSPPVVVCVDDDPQVLSAVQRLLRREPYELLTTEKPETALRWLVERGVGLLITDLRMPDMDGSDLVKVVEERFPETASLILTGYPDLAPTRTGPRLIAKPWDDAELKDAIRALLLGRAVPREIVGFRPQPGEDKGRLLVVAEDPRVRGRAGAAAPAERFDVHVALHPDEGLRLIKDLHPAVEVVVVDSRITVWPLRQALPDATIIVLAEAPSSEEIRRWYDMGIEQVLRLSVSTNALSAAVHHCVLRVREQRKDARRRAIERSRRAADPWWKRGGRTVLGWMRAPARSRVGERRILLGFSAAAVLIGVFLGITWRAIQQIPPLDFLGAGSDPMDRFRWMSVQEQAQRRWYLEQELQIQREIQAETQRDHELQLRPPPRAQERPDLLEPKKR